MLSFSHFLRAQEQEKVNLNNNANAMNHGNSRPHLFFTSIYRNLKFTITIVMCFIFIISLILRQMSESKFLTDLYNNICKTCTDNK